MATPQEHVEARRNELAEIQDRIAGARDEYARLTAAVSLERLRQDREQSLARAAVARREARVLRLWQKLKSRIQSERQRAQQAEARSRELIESDRARLEFRDRALALGESRLAGRARALGESFRKLRSVEALAFNEHRHVDALRAELAGLDARAAHARARLTVPTPLSSPAPALPGDFAHPIEQLADLRAGLLSQAQEMLEQLAAREHEIRAAAEALASVADTLAMREQAVKEQELDVSARLFAIERDQAKQALRNHRLMAREARLMELHRSWATRVDQAVRELEEARAEAEDAREQWAELADVARRVRSEVLRREQELAARELALLDLRNETLDATDRPAVAERRLERRRQRWLTRWAGDARELESDTRRLEAWAVRLDERERRVQEREERLATQVAEPMEISPEGVVSRPAARAA
jgi:chromosome segregation ATPase